MTYYVGIALIFADNYPQLALLRIFAYPAVLPLRL